VEPPPELCAGSLAPLLFVLAELPAPVSELFFSVGRSLGSGELVEAWAAGVELVPVVAAGSEDEPDVFVFKVGRAPSSFP
jgi:hypothetical protein